MWIMERQMNTWHRFREDRAGFLGVITYGHHQINRLVNDRIDIFWEQRFGWQTSQLQGFNRTIGNLRLRLRTRRQTLRQSSKVMRNEDLCHLRAAGIARAEHEDVIDFFRVRCIHDSNFIENM